MVLCNLGCYYFVSGSNCGCFVCLDLLFIALLGSTLLYLYVIRCLWFLLGYVLVLWLVLLIMFRFECCDSLLMCVSYLAEYGWWVFWFVIDWLLFVLSCVFLIYFGFGLLLICLC